MYSKELENKLIEVHKLLQDIAKSSKNKLDSGQLNVFIAMAITLKEIKEQVENQQVIDRHLMRDFDKVLSVSVRVFDGNRIDQLLWDIDSELEK